MTKPPISGSEVRLLRALTSTPEPMRVLAARAGWRGTATAREASEGLRHRGLCAVTRSRGPGARVFLAALTPAGEALKEELGDD